ncbi:LysR family transcriptional regulator [Kushneria phosphatilytica]|uniref:LysR family transcriptional regulator n=1 Tax=Kushneria phosphatilytica TaxID=657387 RepID=A0A1S1NWP4_9GAMM|nr:LysR family transcriptional regulator [Kushneria phosphatilytica]OHV11980.1 LysR family transcriptional regulator [Kushneria phosphatilytica]QEL11165.1 LysR family transcriptional regulator [Kushneria phosphatilytica]
MFNAQYFRTFITLVETGSFTHTARKLEMTQPGVSQHIRKLEQYLGRTLLRRHGRRFTLTEAGRRSYDYAIRLFAEHEQFRHSLDDESLDTGDCRMASPASIGLIFYPFALGYQQIHAGLTISYNFAFNDEIVQDVLAGRCDVGIVTSLSRHPDLSFELWHHEPLCLVVPADFRGNSLNELMALGFVNYADGVHNASQLLRENYAGEFRSISHFPQKGYTNDVGVVLDAVARGLGFTVVPRSVLETSPWQRQVRELPLITSVYEALYLVTRQGSELPRRYGQLLADFRQERRNALYGYSEAPATDSD